MERMTDAEFREFIAPYAEAKYLASFDQGIAKVDELLRNMPVDVWVATAGGLMADRFVGSKKDLDELWPLISTLALTGLAVRAQALHERYRDEPAAP